MNRNCTEQSVCLFLPLQYCPRRLRHHPLPWAGLRRQPSRTSLHPASVCSTSAPAAPLPRAPIWVHPLQPWATRPQVMSRTLGSGLQTGPQPAHVLFRVCWGTRWIWKCGAAYPMWLVILSRHYVMAKTLSISDYKALLFSENNLYAWECVTNIAGNRQR